jgi:hypothetical protein
MPTALKDYSWLPDHQLHVASTLGHVDDLIEQCSKILIDYLRPGPFEFENVRDGELVLTKIKTVRPLPEAVSRYVADALTQLRAAIEHTLFADVEHRLGRPLAHSEANSIEMPALEDSGKFDGWLKARRRSEIDAFVPGGELTRRIESLQPYQSDHPDEHPMRVLAAHTNHSKHRSPSVASTQLGVIVPDVLHPKLTLASGPERAARVGDVLATAPIQLRIGISIIPNVSIQRPHNGSWRVVMKELGALEEWVRTIAVPTLITGGPAAEVLPAQLDTTIGHTDMRAAIISARGLSAAERSEQLIVAESMRDELVEMLVNTTDLSDPETRAWVEQLSDEAVLQRLDDLGQAAALGPLHAATAMIELRNAVKRYSSAGHYSL